MSVLPGIELAFSPVLIVVRVGIFFSSLYYTILYFTVLHYSSLFCFASLYCTILLYTVLQCTRDMFEEKPAEGEGGRNVCLGCTLRPTILD